MFPIFYSLEGVKSRGHIVQKDFCFLGEIKAEEILREINPETYIEEREVKFFYLTPSEKSKEIISKLILEGKILSFTYGKQGGYVITEGENYKSVINEV